MAFEYRLTASMKLSDTYARFPFSFSCTASLCLLTSNVAEGLHTSRHQAKLHGKKVLTNLDEAGTVFVLFGVRHKTFHRHKS